jgi:LysR family glycine cleavage system transcriptional activator
VSSHRLPPLNSLRAFEAVARLRSLRKAAEELFVTPAAVTHQIKSLEDHLGIPLFIRKPRGMELTAAAQAALPVFKRAFELLSRGVSELRAHSQTPRLTVRATPTFASRWLMPRLEGFLETHPGIDVRLLGSGQFAVGTAPQAPADDIAEAPAEADIEIQFTSSSPEGPAVDLLFAVEVTPMCHPRILAGKKALKVPDDLANHTLLHSDGAIGDRSRSTWARWLRKAGATKVDPRRGLQFDHSTMALEAAADGLGVTLAMPLLAAAELDRGDVQIAFPLPLPLNKAYYAVTRESELPRPEVAEFRAWLLAEAGKSRSGAPEANGEHRLKSLSKSRK